ncbi:MULTISPECIES: class I SAM-dependent methyltransferase [unclassified Curtobacterium]|uniref:N5-glutamine methyltransferase family protein n=1 Tax=unclassified Curtobacterium TaxID=257496 RepID=UPI0021AC3285|nr:MULTISPECIES: class I SAM-dependent methyltransferase [unclassified Curtobacterium]WIB15074.1 class I SAM-dependent methyltransferase [Curtobacterium sp. MCPF17_050]
MSEGTAQHRLPAVVADPRVTSALAADLAAAGYTVEGVDALWGTEAAAALHRGTRVAALRALAARPTTPLSTVATLFVLGLPVSRADADRGFPTTGVDALVSAGVLRTDADRVAPALDLRPYAFVDDLGAGSWWIASDLGELALGHAISEEHVLGIGGATTTLSGLQLPVPVRRVLDLGTGCGVQAMHARRFADEVVATDISSRALAIARFNALLNGVDGIDFRLGSLFEPVAGERFDRIVSNPPFVITPRREGVPAYEYRDGGMVGDALVETVLRGLADHLEPGGTAQLLGNWEHRWGTDGLDRVASWFADTDLDVWVVEREREDPPAYAETWIRDGGTKPGSPEFDDLVDAWLDDFRDRHVTGVGFGYVVVRSPSGPRGSSPAPLRRFERLPQVLGSNPAGLGATVARALDAVSWLAAHDDRAFADAHLRVAGDVTEERHYWPGNDDPTVMALVQGGGFGRRVDADTALAAFVGAADGELAVGQIVGAIAQLTGVDEAALSADLVPRLRDLVLDGLLLPA